MLLRERVNYEPHAEVNRPQDPIQVINSQSKSISELNTNLTNHLEMLRKRYPGYVDFYYKFNYTTPSKGCYSAWFDLMGIKNKE